MNQFEVSDYDEALEAKQEENKRKKYYPYKSPEPEIDYSGPVSVKDALVSAMMDDFTRQQNYEKIQNENVNKKVKESWREPQKQAQENQVH